MRVHGSHQLGSWPAAVAVLFGLLALPTRANAAAPACIVTCPESVTVAVDDSDGLCLAGTASFPAPTVGPVDCAPNNVVVSASGVSLTCDASGCQGDFPPYDTTVTVTNQGEFACEFHVWVDDSQIPDIVCPETMSFEAGAMVEYEVTTSDNCPGASVHQTEGIESGTTFDGNPVQNCFMATDAWGNTHTCCFDVLLLASSALETDLAIFKSNGVDEVSAGDTTTYTIAVVNNGSEVAADAHVIDLLPAAFDFASWTCAGGGGGGCTASGSGLTLDEIVFLPAGGSVTFTVEGQLSPQATGILVNVVDVAPLGGVSDTDPNNNSATDIDTIIPATPACSLTCPANVNVANDASQCGAVVDYPAPTPAGGCGAVVASPPSGSFFPVGTTGVTAADQDSGASCSFDVTVTDGEAPQISCPEDLYLTSYDSCSAAGTTVTFAEAGVSDNCPGASVGQTAGPASGESFPLGVSSVSLLAGDSAGNTAGCAFVVNVADGIAPLCDDPGEGFFFVAIDTSDGPRWASCWFEPPESAGASPALDCVTDTSGALLLATTAPTCGGLP